MLTTTSNEVIRSKDLTILKKSIFGFLIFAIFTALIIWLTNPNYKDAFIQKTINTNGSIEKGGRIFRMNCVGCHGISGRGLVGPDLHEVTRKLSDPRIINQVRKGLTPPMPSFEVDSKSMADLLAYMHSLK